MRETKVRDRCRGLDTQDGPPSFEWLLRAERPAFPAPSRMDVSQSRLAEYAVPTRSPRVRNSNDWQYPSSAGSSLLALPSTGRHEHPFPREMTPTLPAHVPLARFLTKGQNRSWMVVAFRTAYSGRAEFPSCTV